jgi:hypothetical protein
MVGGQGGKRVRRDARGTCETTGKEEEKKEEDCRCFYEQLSFGILRETKVRNKE